MVASGLVLSISDMESAMKTPAVILALGVVLTASQPAPAEILQGDRFITAMKDNTVFGWTMAGTAYNLYFLPGGPATYADAAGRHVGGRWQLDRSGDVCIAWNGDTPLRAGCYRVQIDGRRVTWRNKFIRIDEMLGGGVINAFSKR
jgi:hypothetical protein